MRMYLSADVWSARYERKFFTVKLEGYELADGKSPIAHCPDTIKANSTFPAYYYRVVICCGHDRTVVLRRYSQFKWLWKELMLEGKPHTFPPGTCPWQRQDDRFAAQRMQELYTFLDELLQQLPSAQHTAVSAFLEL